MGKRSTQHWSAAMMEPQSVSATRKKVITKPEETP